MSNSNFDPASFLEMEVNDAFDDSFTPIPEGEYQAQIVDVVPRTVDTKNGERIIVGLQCLITDQQVAEDTGIAEPKIKYDMWIDQDDNGALSTGVNQNIALGHIRECLGQNEAGKPWTFAMLSGGALTVKVKHRLTDNQRIMAEVAEVSKAA